jgi:hypothetical protein
MVKKLLALVVCLAIVTALAPSYVSAASPDSASRLTAEQQFTQAIDKLQPYLSISETGNIVLGAPKGIVESIDSEVYESLLAGLAQTNSMIDDGYLVANPDFTVVVTEECRETCSQSLEPGSDVVAKDNVITMSLTSGGITACYTYWWGCWVYLSDDLCDQLVLAMNIGAGIGAIIAAVFPPSAPIAGVIAGVLWIGASLITYFNADDTGIEFGLFLYVTVFYIGAQTDPCGTLAVTIGDAATGYPLPYSTFTVKDEETQEVLEGFEDVETDFYGRKAVALPPGTYTVTASHLTFQSVTHHNVVVSDGQSTTQYFLLPQESPGPIPMTPIPVLVGTT